MIELHEGLTTLESKYSVDETIDRLQRLLTERNIKVFSVIDHSGEAERVGLKLRPTKLVIFGAPQAGTPLMQAAPMTAIDLPLKAFVWQNDSGEGSCQFQFRRVSPEEARISTRTGEECSRRWRASSTGGAMTPPSLLSCSRPDNDCCHRNLAAASRDTYQNEISATRLAKMSLRHFWGAFLGRG